jgi:hypothetical protein
VSGERVLTYRCAPTIRWVKDANRTLVVEAEKGRAWSLDGVEAVVWDLLALDYPAGRIARFLAMLLGESREEAGARLLTMIQAWEETGILQAVRVEGRG